MRMPKLLQRRLLINRIATLCSWLSMLLVVGGLFSILWLLIVRGISGLNWDFITLSTAPPGMRGGMANAIVGSLFQTGIATLIGAPFGILTGIYLSEYPSTHWLPRTIRFIANMLLSAPSILIGLAVYMILVVPFGHFSAISGSVALAIIAIPIIIRVTEDMLQLVPIAIREAGVALGIPLWRVILFICLPCVKDGVITGCLLAIARIAGETAPLLFTSLGNTHMSLDPSAPMASLPISIYQYAGSAYSDWNQQAWSAALLITMGVLFLNIIVKIRLRKEQ